VLTIVNNPGLTGRPRRVRLSAPGSDGFTRGPLAAWTGKLDVGSAMVAASKPAPRGLSTSTRLVEVESRLTEIVAGAKS